MNQEDKQKLRNKINLKIGVLRKEIQDLEEVTRPIPPDNTLSNMTRMDVVNNRTINEGALQMARAKLYRLENALTNIDGPNFGVCASCKGHIPFKRIMAIPESLICIDCAEG